MKHNEFKKLKSGNYKAYINSSLKKGYLKYSDVKIKGIKKSRKHKKRVLKEHVYVFMLHLCILIVWFNINVRRKNT